MFWPLNKIKAWRVQRQETLIARATLLGLEIEYVPRGWTRAHQDMLRIETEHYRAAAPVHSGIGSVSVYGRTPYQVAKQWMKLQELT